MYLTLYDGTLYAMKLADAMEHATSISKTRVIALPSAARLDGVSHIKNFFDRETFRKQYTTTAMNEIK